MQRRQTKHSDKVGALLVFLAIFWPGATAAATEPEGSALSPTNIFAPVSTPAQSIFDLSVLVLMVTATIPASSQRCATGIEPNEKRIKEHLDNSLMLVTALNPPLI